MNKQTKIGSDKERAKRIYRRALKLSREGKDWPTVIKLLKESRKLKNADAMYALGDLYCRGVHIKLDYTKGERYWREAAKHGNEIAAYNLGVSYETGVGETKDLQKAFRFYLIAALLGNKNGAYEIYRLFWYGIGVHTDREVAKRWRSFFERLGKFEE